MSELDLTAPKCLIAFRLPPHSICPFNKIRQITNGQKMTRINLEKNPWSINGRIPAKSFTGDLCSESFLFPEIFKSWIPHRRNTGKSWRGKFVQNFDLLIFPLCNSVYIFIVIAKWNIISDHKTIEQLSQLKSEILHHTSSIVIIIIWS